MSNSDWFGSFVKNYREDIIDAWLTKVDTSFPGLYELRELRKNGAILFELLVDIESPLEEHERFEIIHQLCMYHLERDTPFEHVLHSSHLWREAIMRFIWPQLLEQNLSFEEQKSVISTVSSRIDHFQRVIGRTYAEYSETLIHQQDKKIRSLHDDRLSILGKMSASMAHEIRNPLTVIEGFLKLVKSNLSEESLSQVSKYFSIIDNEFNSLSRQVTGFLAFSKDNGVDEVFCEYNSSDYIQTVVELIQPRCSNENIELTLSLNPFIFKVQKVGLQQVLLNVLNNAVDALQMIEGPKQIRISSFEEEDCYRILVQDNGLGIPEDIKGTIFEPFMTGKQNGTGLGLSICKRIMEKNNGDISFLSKEGETTFILSVNKKVETLPLSQPLTPGKINV